MSSESSLILTETLQHAYLSLAKAIDALDRHWGVLNAQQAAVMLDLRKETELLIRLAIIKDRAAGSSVTGISTKFRLTKARISQLTKTA